MTTAQVTATRTRTAERALTRAVLYRLLSQSLTYPDADAVDMLRRDDLPRANDVAPSLPHAVAAPLSSFSAQAAGADADELARDHRRIFGHLLSVDCPPYETVFTTRQIFEETEQLADLAGFYRAFGVELAEHERPDHISVELEFMQLLAYKEAYARVHHTAGKVRLCRDAERAFIRDHLGRWAPKFAQLLHRKAGGGFYAGVAHLTRAFMASEVKHLRVQPEAITDDPEIVMDESLAEGCPFAEECATPEMGGSDVRVYSP